MINMRENKFDVEGMKKKIRNFLRTQISKRPELVERWNEIMNSNVEDHDDYGDLAHIEKIFKNYRDFNNNAMGIQYEPDTNSFTFYIPLKLDRIYEDWGVRDEIKKEIDEDGKKYFETENFNCYWSRMNSSDSTFFCKVNFGNSYLTPKRKINQALQQILKSFGTEVTSYESFIEGFNPKTKNYDLKTPVTVHIYDNTIHSGPHTTAVWWEIHQQEDYGNKVNAYSCNLWCNNTKYWFEATEESVVKKIVADVLESMGDNE